MKRVIRFTKIRFFMMALSLVLILAGIAGTVMRGGFNLGIDFQAGLNQRIQIAPVAFLVNYSGTDEAVINVARGQLEISRTVQGEEEEIAFTFSAYPTLKALAAAVSDIPGFSVTMSAGEMTASSQLIGFSYPVTVSGNSAPVNYRDSAAPVVEVEEIRSILSSLGNVQIQIMGDRANQEFSLRLQDPGEEKDFAVVMSQRIVQLLGARFGADQIIVKQSDYVGARFSSELGSSVVSMTALALILILAYIWFRFKLAFAVSAIIALAHDVLIMIGFIGAFQMEVVTATVAAVLTIIGYSLNDTIVIFDRIRENNRIMRDSDFQNIVDTSISQSLSRTIITSLTTLLAVVSLYIFGSGPIRDFALAMIVGVVVGTYSSIFIASPILLGWLGRGRRRSQSEIEERQSSRRLIKDDSADDTEEAPSAVVSPVKKRNTAVVTEIPMIERKLKKKKKKK